MQQQPAKINYFFKDGYAEFGRTVGATFVSCGNAIMTADQQVKASFAELLASVLSLLSFKNFFGDLWESIGNGVAFGFFLGKLIFLTCLTPVLCAVFSVLQGLTLSLVMGIIYLVFLVVAGLDGIYTSLKKISTSCPNCQAKYSLPTYVCECGAHHTKLVPSKYGVFKRQCECGRELSTTFLNGRHKLPGKWICPSCSYDGQGGPLQSSIAIPVVGGPSSGKTCYINMAIKELEDNAKERYDLDFEYSPNYALGDEYETNKKKMQSGVVPSKTNDKRMKYYQFYLAPEGEKVRNLISLCDVAGEAYEDTTSTQGQVGFKYANAFLMVVDPLSVTKYREELEGNNVDIGGYGVSQRPMDEVLNSLIVTLENMKCIDPKNSAKTEVAIVFSKNDIPGIEKKIGAYAVDTYMNDHPEVKNQYEATNKVCEEFLIEYDEANFINTLKSKFKNIQFFTCSALGHCEDGSAFTPVNVEDAVLWLIDKYSLSIDLSDKWGFKI